MSTVKKYYENITEGWLRITIVDWDSAAGAAIDEGVSRFGKEIDESDLPAEFNSWSSYDRFGQDDCSVNIVSPAGE